MPRQGLHPSNHAAALQQKSSPDLFRQLTAKSAIYSVRCVAANGRSWEIGFESLERQQ